MANPYKRKGSDTYTLRYKDGRGRWRSQTSSARTKKAAMELQRELEVRAERQRRGLEELPPEDGGGTLQALFEWWLKEHAARLASAKETTSAVRLYFLGSPLADLRLAEVDAAAIERHLAGLPEHLSPATVNKARGYLSAAFGAAIRTGRWRGSNPVVGVAKRKVPKKAFDYLRLDEVPALFAALKKGWRPLFVTAIYTGLRKGELFALRKRDVDLAAGLLSVTRSHNRDTTKNNRPKVIAIHPELEPVLRSALEATEGEILFPDAKGRQRKRDTNMVAVLKRALGRAGIVTGYEHRCRRRGCGHREGAPDDQQRRCPTCGMKLWPVPLPRKMRFHDLRHTSASLYLQAGSSLTVVQRLMGHTDPKITTEVYGHFAHDHTRAELSKLRLGTVAGEDAAKAGQDEPRPEGSPADAPGKPEGRGQAPDVTDDGGNRLSPADDPEGPEPAADTATGEPGDPFAAHLLHDPPDPPAGHHRPSKNSKRHGKVGWRAWSDSNARPTGSK